MEDATDIYKAVVKLVHYVYIPNAFTIVIRNDFNLDDDLLKWKLYVRPMLPTATYDKSFRNSMNRNWIQYRTHLQITMGFKYLPYFLLSFGIPVVI